MLWRTYGQCENYGVLTGHKGAILDLQWSRDSRVVFSASADATLASWDLETGTRIRRHIGHDDAVDCMDISRRGEEILVSGSDDSYIGVSTKAELRLRNYTDSEINIDLGSATETSSRLYRNRFPCDSCCIIRGR